MKSPLSILFVLLAVLFLAACSPPPLEAIYTSQAVQIPLDLQLAINATLLFGVTFGLQWLFEVVHIDLRGIGTLAASAVAEFGILYLQGWINHLPAQYDFYVLLGLNVLLAILTTFGFARVLFRRERAAAMFNPLAPKIFG